MPARLDYRLAALEMRAFQLYKQENYPRRRSHTCEAGSIAGEGELCRPCQIIGHIKNREKTVLQNIAKATFDLLQVEPENQVAKLVARTMIEIDRMTKWGVSNEQTRIEKVKKWLDKPVKFTKTRGHGTVMEMFLREFREMHMPATEDQLVNLQLNKLEEMGIEVELQDEQEARRRAKRYLEQK